MNSRGLLPLVLGLPLAAQQVADPDFRPSVPKPAYARNGPAVVIDEAHGNFHTADGRYKPLADLLRSDGYRVVAGTQKFGPRSLPGAGVLIISNALGESGGPAFTEQECDVVRDWVRDGGSLLLIADHAPFGGAAENLGKRFGVEMGRGWAFDLGGAEGLTTQLDFSRANGLLGTHPILRGRDASEEVKTVRSFTGQSLSAPEGATVLMKLGATAREALTPEDFDAELKAPGSRARSVAGRAQGLAIPFGKGRVVMLGEAAMLSAQIVRFTEDGKQTEFKMGMNVPGTDDRQFALNVLHWLSRLLN
jgi:hypothetical protein